MVPIYWYLQYWYVPRSEVADRKAHQGNIHVHLQAFALIILLTQTLLKLHCFCWIIIIIIVLLYANLFYKKKLSIANRAMKYLVLQQYNQTVKRLRIKLIKINFVLIIISCLLLGKLLQFLLWRKVPVVTRHTPGQAHNIITQTVRISTNHPMRDGGWKRGREREGGKREGEKKQVTILICWW